MIICGAGITGLALAIALRRRGHAVQTIERRPGNPSASQGGGIQLTGNATAIIEYLGLDNQYRSICEMVASVPVRRYSDGDCIARLPRHQPFSMLYESALELDVTLCLGKRLRAVHTHNDGSSQSYIAEIDDGLRITSDLIVTADGCYSTAHFAEAASSCISRHLLKQASHDVPRP